MVISVVSGCTPHRSGVPDNLIETPAAYSTMVRMPSQPAGLWWERFKDDELNLIMEEAFKYNLDIAGSYERLMQAESVLRINESAGGVKLIAAGQAGRVRQSAMGSAVTVDSYSLSGAASYEIDLWRKLGSTTDAAHFEMLASRENLKAMFMTVSARVAELYFLAVEQRALLELSEETISSFEETLEMVERRYKGGLVPAIDVYQSRLNLSAALAKRPLYESNLKVAQNALAVITGKFPNINIGGDLSELMESPAFPTGIPSQLLKRRPDIRASLMKIYASDKKVAAAVADRFPSFNLAGSYGGASEEISTILDSPNIFWSALLQAALPVIDSGRRKAEVNRTESVLRENLALYHENVLNAFKEVEDSLSKVASGKERIDVLDESVVVSGYSLNLSLERYKFGLTDYLPVLSAQVTNVNAKNSLLTAKKQLISDTIQLARALGGEWTEDVMNNYFINIETEVEK